MLREEIRQLPTTPKDLRKFGWTVGGVLLVLGAWFLYRHKPAAPYLLAPGGVLVLLGVCVPAALKQVYLAWMTLALVLGLVVSTVLLTLFFYLVVTPIGWGARLAGKDFLSLKLDPKAGSYWIVRPPPVTKSAHEYEQQY